MSNNESIADRAYHDGYNTACDSKPRVCPTEYLPNELSWLRGYDSAIKDFVALIAKARQEGRLTDKAF